MPTAFNPKTRVWQRQFPESLAQHDLVFQSPPEDALQGLPLGNGDLGLLLWTEGSRLVAAINKVDLFDDYPDSRDGMVGKPPYDHEPSLRHGARLSIDFGMPIFDILYLQDFTARLGLADAAAVVTAATPFLSVKIKAFASHTDQVIVLDCEASAAEPIAIQALLERYGSRPYSYWYSGFNRDASIGLAGTDTTVQADTLLIHQKLRTLDFVVGARMTGVQMTAERTNSHAGRLTTSQALKVNFQLLITLVTSENAADPQAAVLAILDQAAGKGVQVLYAEHALDWRKFWQASFISIPGDYLENIWHLNLYHANSACRSAYPPRFNNGLWTWNRDVSNWVYYFHWNMQNFIWPLHTANHPELAGPYFNFRSRSLPNAMAYAKRYQGHEGAFYADVADRRGNNVGTHWNNQTPGSQIALLYWKHYEFTRDQHFLEQDAWPVIREVARYYADLVVKNDGGAYYTPCSQAYEGSPLFAEVITDTAMIKALMPVAAACARLVGFAGEEVDLWQDIAANMNDFHTQPLDEDEYDVDEQGVQKLRHGLGKGSAALSGQAFTVGKFLMIEGAEREDFQLDKVPEYVRGPLAGIEPGDRIRCRHGNPARASYYGIPDPEFAPVFPAGLIGLKDKGSPLFQTSVDQVRLHPSTLPPDTAGDATMAGNNSSMCMGWCPYPVVLARLGLAAEAAEAIENSLMAWQFYCQGFGHYGPYEVFTKDKDNRWHTNTVTEFKTGARFPSPAWPFRHFTFESVPIVCTAINEMLIQSHDGTIRLLPAVPADWSGSFQLAAAGGFCLHAQFTGGRLDWAAVESQAGLPCSLINPWGEASVFVTVLNQAGDQVDAFQAQPIRQSAGAAESTLAFATVSGRLYLLTLSADALAGWQTETIDFEPNQAMKKLGKAQLGLPRMF